MPRIGSVLFAFLLAAASILVAPPSTALANGDGQSVTIDIPGPGVISRRLPDGNRLVITTTGPAHASKPLTTALSRNVTVGIAALSNHATVGIDMYDTFGVLLWRFSEDVIWSWDGSQVLSDFPTSAANTFAPLWYVASQPAPSTFWDLFPTREGNYAQATFSCCSFIPVQSQNPQIWITVDALGGWSARTQCC